MRILVVDDDPASRLLLQVAVEQLGHVCIPAVDGEDAWRLLPECEPDVVVTDWVMPGIDGLELCRRIRAVEGGTYTYVIVVTSRTEREHVRTGMDAGADDYLTKPLDPFELEVRLIAAERVTALHAQLDRYRADLVRLAYTDPLTQLRNRRLLTEDLATLHANAERYERRYCVAMCDIDSFKAYNDTYGHPAGDEVLRTVARTLTEQLRDADALYRFGGEEFLVLLPDQAASSAAVALERVRSTLEGLGLPHQHGVGGVVTISAGVAELRPGEDATADDVLARADAALYDAKCAGRNRIAPPPEA